LRARIVVKNASRLLSDANQRAVLSGKLLHRLATPWARVATQRALAHYTEHVEDYESLVSMLDPGLWRETLEFSSRFRVDARDKLRKCPVPFGGAGATELLYFLVRLKRPAIVLETGVAAGWSSAAILHGMAVNEVGHLFSSDFPYLRYRDAERYIGLLVPDEIRHRWTILDQGDRSNLPRLLRMMNGDIDLFHYDSDKSYSGRSSTYELIRERLAGDAVVIFDDIQDNSHFRDLVRTKNLAFHVFGYGRRYRKYLGVTGLDQLFSPSES